MGATHGTKKREKDVSTKSRGRLKPGNSPFTSKSIQSELKLAKTGRLEDKLSKKLEEVEDVIYESVPSLHDISSPIESSKRVEKRQKDKIVSRESLKEEAFSYQFPPKSIHSKQKSAKLGLKPAQLIEGDTHRKHRLLTKRRKRYDYFSSSDIDEEYISSGSSTSSSSEVAIKLSAEYLILRRESREEYLMDTFMESTEHRGSRRKPVLVEFLVDLTEIELELGKKVERQETSDSEYYGLTLRKFELFEILRINKRFDCGHCSLVVTQTEGKNKVSDCAMKTVSETFYQLNGLFHLQSVDVSGCSLLTQISLLPGLLSAIYMKRPCSSTRIICQFSKDFLQLKEDELMHLLNLTKPLLLEGDVWKERYQELISKLFLCNSYYHSRNEKVTYALIEAGADVNISDKDCKTALFYAVDDEEAPCALIEAGADVNITEDGKTALFFAEDNEKLTHALIEAGADVNITDKDGKTALFGAASSNEKVTYALIAAGADVKITDKDGRTALFRAVENEKVTRALIEAGADVNITDKDGRTALFYIKKNEKVAHALIKAGADVNITDKDGITAFFYNKSNEKVRHAMIEAAADVNITDYKDGKTALFYAVDNEKVTHALIGAGAVVNITDKDGKTALFYAVDNEKVSHALIKAGVDVKITDKNGKTAWFYAVDNEKVTHALIEAGADVNIRDKDGKTALFYAIDNEKVTHALNEAGADVNITDKDGKTALFYAVENEKVTHALIEAGADVNTTDKDDKTALFYVTWNEKVTHVLIEAGADMNITDKDGKTVLLCVFDSSSKACKKRCKILLEGGSSLCETTKKQESVFHLALNVCQEKILSSSKDREHRDYIWFEIMDALELFSESSEAKVAVNKRDMQLNSPLHLWASLAFASSYKYHEDLLMALLDVLVRCGIKLNYSNEQEQTPLHVCRTWTAVKMLLEAGAKTDVTDSSGCTPLLLAATKSTCIKRDCLYPDVTQNPKEFWKEVINKKLDPWTADKDGNTVLSILVKEGGESLAKALIEVACELKLVQSDAIGVPLLITICKDKSTDKEWKVDLVKTLLKYRNSLAQESLSDEDTALYFCCINMLELPENSVKTSVHWKIAQHLILCGADVGATGKEGKSCLDIAESCPVLKELLLNKMHVNIEEVPPLIDLWKPVSKRHQGQLEKVARSINCQQIETVCYFKEALDNGTFGLVFVGINTQDGKEVAVKRIQTTRVETENIKKEIEDLKLDMTCDKVIQCLLCTHDKDFLYLILELMEGNLDDLLSGDNSFYINQKTELCRDICMGLDYLHSRDIIHKGIKPSNILYQVIRSGVNLKLAFFGLRQQMCNDQLSPNFRNTYESLSKERCWMAPEVLQSQIHSKSSDVFSCGLVIHYLLTNKKHPFAPAGSSKDNSMRTVIIQTVGNIAKNIIELDETISSDAKDLVKRMLRQDEMRRPNTTRILGHGFFLKVE